VFVSEVDGFSVSAADMEAAGWVKAERLREANATVALLEAEMGARPSGSANDAVRLGAALADRDAAVRRKNEAELALRSANAALCVVGNYVDLCPVCRQDRRPRRGHIAHNAGCVIGIALAGAEVDDG
jgi:hypothetical protein